eukprot:PhM_4_TR13148/c0_g1_i1/m.58435
MPPKKRGPTLWSTATTNFSSAINGDFDRVAEVVTGDLDEEVERQRLLSPANDMQSYSSTSSPMHAAQKTINNNKITAAASGCSCAQSGCRCCAIGDAFDALVLDVAGVRENGEVAVVGRPCSSSCAKRCWTCKTGRCSMYARLAVASAMEIKCNTSKEYRAVLGVLSSRQLIVVPCADDTFQVLVGVEDAVGVPHLTCEDVLLAIVSVPHMAQAALGVRLKSFFTFDVVGVEAEAAIAAVHRGMGGATVVDHAVATESVPAQHRELLDDQNGDGGVSAPATCTIHTFASPKVMKEDVFGYVHTVLDRIRAVAYLCTISTTRSYMLRHTYVPIAATSPDVVAHAAGVIKATLGAVTTTVTPAKHRPCEVVVSQPRPALEPTDTQFVDLMRSSDAALTAAGQVCAMPHESTLWEAGIESQGPRLDFTSIWSVLQGNPYLKPRLVRGVLDQKTSILRVVCTRHAAPVLLRHVVDEHLRANGYTVRRDSITCCGVTSDYVFPCVYPLRISNSVTAASEVRVPWQVGVKGSIVQRATYIGTGLMKVQCGYRPGARTYSELCALSPIANITPTVLQLYVVETSVSDAAVLTCLRLIDRYHDVRDYMYFDETRRVLLFVLSDVSEKEVFAAARSVHSCLGWKPDEAAIRLVPTCATSSDTGASIIMPSTSLMSMIQQHDLKVRDGGPVARPTTGSAVVTFSPHPELVMQLKRERGPGVARPPPAAQIDALLGNTPGVLESHCELSLQRVRIRFDYDRLSIKDAVALLSQLEGMTATPISVTTSTFIVHGMSCGSCAAFIETSLNKNPRVLRAVVNFTTTSAVVVHDAASWSPESVLETIKGLGYTVRLASSRKEHLDGDESGAPAATSADQDVLDEARKALVREDEIAAIKKNFIGSFVLTLWFWVSMGLHDTGNMPHALTSTSVVGTVHLGDFISAVLCTLVVCWFGRQFFCECVGCAPAHVVYYGHPYCHGRRHFIHIFHDHACATCCWSRTGFPKRLLLRHRCVAHSISTSRALSRGKCQKSHDAGARATHGSSAAACHPCRAPSTRRRSRDGRGSQRRVNYAGGCCESCRGWAHPC